MVFGSEGEGGNSDGIQTSVLHITADTQGVLIEFSIQTGPFLRVIRDTGNYSRTIVVHGD